MSKLANRKVIILSEDGFEESELVSPKTVLETQGAKVDIVSPQKESIRSWDKENWGITLGVDKNISDVSVDDYDALLLPGGVMNPDKLRENKDAVGFVKAFMESGKPIASICHGPQTLIETGLVRDRKMTSYSAIKTDLINAGANWVDQEVVVDNGLVTSRSPKDLDAFNDKMVEEFAEGEH